jgi:hypothetical protein
MGAWYNCWLKLYGNLVSHIQILRSGGGALVTGFKKYGIYTFTPYGEYSRHNLANTNLLH